MISVKQWDYFANIYISIQSNKTFSHVILEKGKCGYFMDILTSNS